MVTLGEYFISTLDGVSINAVFVGVIFAMLVMDLRKFFKVDDFIEKLKNPLLKILIIILFYPLVILSAFIGFMIVISLFWGLSLLN